MMRVILVIILIIVGAGAYFWWQKGQANTNSANLVLNAMNQSTNAPSNINSVANANTTLNTNIAVNANTPANLNTAVNTNTAVNSNTNTAVDTSGWLAETARCSHEPVSQQKESILTDNSDWQVIRVYRGELKFSYEVPSSATFNTGLDRYTKTGSEEREVISEVNLEGMAIDVRWYKNNSSFELWTRDHENEIYTSYIASSRGAAISEPEQIVVDGRKTKTYEVTSPFGFKVMLVFVEDGDKIYQIEVRGPAENMENFKGDINKVLMSFHFEIPDPGELIFTYREIDLSFRYPSSVGTPQLAWGTPVNNKNWEKAMIEVGQKGQSAFSITREADYYSSHENEWLYTFYGKAVDAKQPLSDLILFISRDFKNILGISNKCGFVEIVELDQYNTQTALIYRAFVPHPDYKVVLATFVISTSFPNLENSNIDPNLVIANDMLNDIKMGTFQQDIIQNLDTFRAILPTIKTATPLPR